MSWIEKTIPKPRHVHVLVCDGCQLEIEDGYDSKWSRLSVDHPVTAEFHFCATCRPVVVKLLREGFGAAASQALKVTPDGTAP